ncbi:hypothetical protein AMJ40_04200 [candidate division TA06 bacterium DG_26]|uniref:SHSP domain-containing protein n=1 Tax=candidate division TA06 bacterium DG_26 TaxID=1703771 RepID=A0A0S7WIK8_UNCT6|nr:MAG: hypothetical protein AMJ40_04200 [candidate division TA06 bacterium DG_26]
MDDAFDRVFDHFLSDFFPRRWRGQWHPEMGWTPMVDLIDKEDHLLLRVDLPGVKKEDVKISVSENNLLTISGETKQSEVEKKDDYYRCERRFGSFSRSVRLPVDVVADQVNANLKNGILEVNLPKRQPKKPKEFEIKIM